MGICGPGELQEGGDGDPSFKGFGLRVGLQELLLETWKNRRVRLKGSFLGVWGLGF